MGDYIPLSQSFAPVDPAQFTQELDQNKSNEQTIAQNKIKLNEAQRLQTQDALVRNIVQKNTTVDPTTGIAATDQKKVVQDLYLTDPEAAEKYQTHVEDIQAERATKEQAAQAAKQAQADKIKKTIGDALSAVDETGDQDQAKTDYASAVQSLKVQGVPIQPGDEVYSPGRVGYWKRLTIGAPQIDKEKSAADINNAKLENAAKIAEQKAEAAAKIAAMHGADAKEVARIRNQGMETAASIRASATVQAANIRGPGGGGVTDDDDDVIDLGADTYIRTGQMPSLGNGSGALKKAILKRAAQKLTQQGGDAGTVASNNAAFKANSKSQANQQTQSDNVQGNIKAMTDNLDNFLDLSAKIPNQSANPVINNIKMAYRDKLKGDPQVRAMLAAHSTALREYAKITAGNPSGAGVLSDSARHEALDTINGNAPIAQKIAAAKVIKQDALNVVKAKQAQVAAINARIQGTGAPANTPPQAPQGSRVVKNKDGSFWFQNLASGALTRAK